MDLPFVSVIIPCRNEVNFIRDCLESILQGDYPHDRIEVLVVDGMSEDGTRDAVSELAKKYPVVRLLDNPARRTPVALNLGIRSANGSIIARIDAHAWVAKNYLSECIRSLRKFEQADNVGGIMHTVPRENTLVGRAVAEVLSHPFGVGSSYFRTHTTEPKVVDTVFGGTYRREVFDKIGGFNERLDRGQDMEFNLRLKKSGGTTLLVPSIVSYYLARVDLLTFISHSWRNGVWAIVPFLYSDVAPVSPRHLVPMVFALNVVSAGVAVVFLPGWIPIVLTAPLICYAFINIVVSTALSIRRKEPRFLVIVPGLLVALHVSYGLGSLVGLVRVIAHCIASFFIRQKQ